MKAKIKKMWVAALRSGEYSQTSEQLRSISGGFCCLGVLCDIYNNEHKRNYWEMCNIYEEDYYFMGEWQFLPPKVWKWAGLSTSNPEVLVHNTEKPLAVLNDDLKLDFNQMADLIEDQL